MSAKKPTVAELQRVHNFLTRVHAEANEIGEALDPTGERDYAWGDPTCLLTVIDGLSARAAHGLRLPALEKYEPSQTTSRKKP